MTTDTKARWLEAASLGLIGFALVVWLGAVPSLSWLNGMFVDLAFWPVDGVPGMNEPATRLMSAIGGSVMAGWGAMLYLVTRKVFRRDPALGRELILAGAGLWFVVDGIGSALVGAPMNIALNAGFLMLFVVPLARHPGQT